MILLNPALLAGLALIAIPVILHLLMRAKPKRLIFPALRLIATRRKQNSQRLRLRHLLLLALRMAIIAALALALARPSVPAADYQFTGADWLRTLAVLGLLAGAYFGCLALWRRSRLPAHQLNHRQSLLRTGLVVLAIPLALGVIGWPYASRVAASITSPTIRADQTLPVSAVLLFDTSLSLDYQLAGRSRLDLAKEIAVGHLKTLPAGSRAALAETSATAPLRFQSDLASLQTRITELATSPLSRPWIDLLDSAFDLHQADRDRPQASSRTETLREVYVFTDLTAAGWPKALSAELQRELTAQNDISLYVIDVAAPQPQNVAIVDLKLADETITGGGDVALVAKLRGFGEAATGTVTAELLVADHSGRLVKQGQAEVTLAQGADQPVEFRATGLTGPIRQGEVRLVAADPLLFDNSRGFTVQVRPATRVLVVAPTKARAQFLLEALDPAELKALGKRKYECVYASPDTWRAKPLSGYAAICLLDLPDPGAEGWKQLLEFTTAGGGLFVSLGGSVQHAAWLAPVARDLLPGELKAALTFNPPEFLDLPDLTHPILKKFADWGATGLTGVEIQKYWLVAPTADATVICRYTDGRQAPAPALLSRQVGAGRVVLFTSGLSREGWNELPVSGWSFVALCDQILRYTARLGDTRWNFLAGDDVSLPLPTEPALRQVLLRKPGLQQVRVDLPPGSRVFSLRDSSTAGDQLGNYRLTSADPATPFDAGFSLAAPASESDLTRLAPDQLTSLFGADRIRVATNIEGLQREVRAGRIGREAMPLVATLLVLLFLVEHLVANFFYEPDRKAS